MKAAGDRARDMGGLGDERVTQRILLLRLTATASLNPQMFFPSDDDTKCRYCGIRKRHGNLCVECEARRLRLAAKFPDVPPPIQAIRKSRSAPTPKEVSFLCASSKSHAG